MFIITLLSYTDIHTYTHMYKHSHIHTCTHTHTHTHTYILFHSLYSRGGSIIIRSYTNMINARNLSNMIYMI